MYLILHILHELLIARVIHDRECFLDTLDSLFFPTDTCLSGAPSRFLGLHGFVTAVRIGPSELASIDVGSQHTFAGVHLPIHFGKGPFGPKRCDGRLCLTARGEHPALEEYGNTVPARQSVHGNIIATGDGVKILCEVDFVLRPFGRSVVLAVVHSTRWLCRHSSPRNLFV